MVTVKIVGTNTHYDMELPAGITIKELSPKLLMALKNIANKMFMGVENIRIIYDIEKRYLHESETLADAGIWDGSVISVERGM